MSDHPHHVWHEGADALIRRALALSAVLCVLLVGCDGASIDASAWAATFDLAHVKASLRDACGDAPGAGVDMRFCDQVQIDDMTADGAILIVPTTLDASARLRAIDICAMLGASPFDADGADLGYERIGVLDRDGGSLAACGTVR